MTGASAPRVAVDAMGSDHGPRVVVEGAVSACRDLGLRVVLVGPRAVVEAELRRAGAAELGITVADAPDVIPMGEKLSRVTLRKRSSIQVAVELVKSGAADAFFSAGNTAACWTIATAVWGRLGEVDRPALATVVPNVSGWTVLLDVGANATCKARHLEEFAVMGHVYAQTVLRISRPRVGLMSMGEEATKGHEVIRSAHGVLRGSRLNFVGNVEGNDVFTGVADVVVMDGFTGNVVLKASESLADALLALIRQEIGRDPISKLGALLLRRVFRAVKRRTDPAEPGGGLLLGVKGCCVIGHGRSTPYAIRQGIKTAASFFENRVNEGIEAELRLLQHAAEVAQVGSA
jgi:phosphate acyltransferase